MMLEAVVFDFDGLVIDSESVIFDTAAAAFAHHGHVLTLDAWVTVVGTAGEDDEAGWARLCAAAGVDFALADYQAAYEAQDRSNRDDLPALPGVVELAQALVDAGVPIGIASSSSHAWLDRHITRLGLQDHFRVLIGRDLVDGVSKPAPDVYLRACADLGADPTRSVALEDSTNGIAAARAAGMATVAVPGRVTRSLDFSAADRVVGSLLELTVPDLVALADRR
jgi:HAD superfamily hydrolase (TIGR01509 family)